MLPHSMHLHEEAATHALGAALARALQPGLIVYLHGDLGAGKTTLTRALLHAAGWQGHVRSPTYALAEPYSLVKPDGLTPLRIVHFDLYRMSSPEEFIEAGLREEFDGQAICLVEWPEKAAPLLPPPDLRITLEMEGEGRRVTTEALSDLGLSCMQHLNFVPNL